MRLQLQLSSYFFEVDSVPGQKTIKTPELFIDRTSRCGNPKLTFKRVPDPDFSCNREQWVYSIQFPNEILDMSWRYYSMRNFIKKEIPGHASYWLEEIIWTAELIAENLKGIKLQSLSNSDEIYTIEYAKENKIYIRLESDPSKLIEAEVDYIAHSTVVTE
jgi:hypothetical protein